MQLPIILFDIHRNRLSNHIRTDKQNFYFYSYQNFNIKILSIKALIPIPNNYGDYMPGAKTDKKPFIYQDADLLKRNEQLFSVIKQPDNSLVVANQREFNSLDNFGYTLYLEGDETEVTLELENSLGEKQIIIVTLRLSNVIDETNEHYLDELINHFLPNYEQLFPALMYGETGLENFSDRELIKRLLLDFRNILKYKGTKASIEKFFNLIGIYNVDIFEEYRVNSNNPDTPKRKKKKTYSEQTTLNPNKLKDTKTGNYHVIYYNWIEEGLDVNNLPIRKFQIDDLTEFFEKLKYAIALANTYFTLEEQEIIFFGITYNTNIPITEAIKSTFNDVWKYDTVHFRLTSLINITTDKIYHKYLVKNNIQTDDKVIYRNEVKYRLLGTHPQSKLYWIDSEIQDGAVLDNDDLESIYSIFGNILRISIDNTSDSVYSHLRYNITVKDLSTNYEINKITELNAGESIDLYYAMLNPSTYHITVNIIDDWNNHEKYFYQYIVDDSSANMDFDVYTSKQMIDINDLTLEIDSPIQLKNPILEDAHILPISMLNQMSNLGLELDKYFQQSISGQIVRWLSNKSKQSVIPDINQYFVVDEISDTIPIELTEQWVNFISFKYNSDFTLKLKMFNPNICQYELIDYWDLNDIIFGEVDYKLIDKLFVTVLDIHIEETGLIEPYVIVMPVETGINLSKELYDLILVDSDDNEISIYEDENSILNNLDLSNVKLLVNYDYPLFTRESTLVPNFHHYIAETDYKILLPNVEGEIQTAYNIMKSMFPRLIKITDPQAKDANILKQADIIVAKLNNDFVAEETNLVWYVFNTFTNELLFSQSEQTLKYRLDDNIIYTIVAKFIIRNKELVIVKDSIISSFNKEQTLNF